MKKRLWKTRVLCIMLVWTLALPAVFCANAETTTLIYSYGSDAFEKHMLDEQNIVEFNGEKWLFEHDSFSFNGAFMMYGGNVRSVCECEIPEFRHYGTEPEEDFYLGKVTITPPASMTLYVFAGDRITGEYKLIDQKNTARYAMDVYAQRDKNGALCLTDMVFLYSYTRNGVKANFAAGLYISYENYAANPAWDIFDEAAQETMMNESAENSYAQMIQLLDGELIKLEKALAEKEQEIEVLEAENESLKAQVSGIDALESETEALRARLEACEAEAARAQELAVRYEQLETECAALESDKAALESENAVLKAELDECAGYEEQIALLISENELLKAETEKGATLLTDSETEVKALEREESAHAVKEKAAESANDGKSLNGNFDARDKKTQVQALEAELYEKEQQIEAMNQEIIALTGEIERAQTETDYSACSYKELCGMMEAIQTELKKRTVEIPASPSDDFVYASNGTQITIRGYRGTDTEIVIPDEIEGVPVTKIASSAFEDNRSIVSVRIPDSVREIGFSAFSGCRNLTSVNIPQKLETLGAYAFMDASIEGVLVFPETIKLIDTGALRRNDLTGVVILGNCTIESGNTIDDMDTLEFIYVREGARVHIKENAIDKMPKMETVILPDSVTMETDNFWSCPLMTVYAPEGSWIAVRAEYEMLPVNTKEYAAVNAYYDSLY